MQRKLCKPNPAHPPCIPGVLIQYTSLGEQPAETNYSKVLPSQPTPKCSLIPYELSNCMIHCLSK